MAPPKKYKDLNVQDQISRRKVDHVQFERKRRERIQTAIQILRQIVPRSRNQVTLHQSNILENAIEYIQSLEQICKKREMDVPPSPCISSISLTDLESNANYSQGVDATEYVGNKILEGNDTSMKIQDILN